MAELPAALQNIAGTSVASVVAAVVAAGVEAAVGGAQRATVVEERAPAAGATEERAAGLGTWGGRPCTPVAGAGAPSLHPPIPIAAASDPSMR